LRRAAHRVKAESAGKDAGTLVPQAGVLISRRDSSRAANCDNSRDYSRAGKVQENPCEFLQIPVIYVIVGNS
jgi:hypothetical protein